MSRLSYNSHSSEDEISLGDDQHSEDEAFDRAEALAMSSYTLHGLGSSRKKNKRKKEEVGGMRKRKRVFDVVENEVEREVVVLDDDEEEEEEEEREVVLVDDDDEEKYGHDHDVCNISDSSSTVSDKNEAECGESASHSTSTTPNSRLSGGSRNSSRWLSVFLSSSRTPSTPPPPPPNSPLKSDFLSQFDQSYKAYIEEKNPGGSLSEGSLISSMNDDSDEDSDEALSKHRSGNNDAFLPPDTIVDNKIHLFNLPYTISIDQIKSTAYSYGVQISDVIINKDASGRPSGSAVVTCEALVSMTTGKSFVKSSSRSNEKDGDLVEMCAFLLNEKQFGTRPIRVHTNQSLEDEKARRRQNNLVNNTGRYFGQVSPPSAPLFHRLI